MEDEAPQVEELLDPKIDAHDRHRFEIKIDVNLPAEARHTYRVETYFFIPRPLHIRAGTFKKPDFYAIIQRYVRFKTPQIGLAQLRDPAVGLSPFVRLKNSVQDILAGKVDDAAVADAYDEIKMLGCMVRVTLRDRTLFFRDEIRKAHNAGAPLNALRDKLSKFTDEVSALVEDVRALRLELSDPIVPQKLREGIAFVDELFSLAVSDSITGLLAEVRAKTALMARLNGVEPRLVELVKLQHRYRASMGYPSVVDKNSPNETLVFRRSVLKKFSSSVLYLDTETSEWERLSQVLFAVAAGAAMAFTILIMGLAQIRYAVDSLPFAIIAVVTYIFKDRIKDLLKLWFLSKWTNWFADRQTLIRDPSTKNVIGKLKEAFSFLPPTAVPSPIMSRRRMDDITSVENDGKPEVVMRYDKEVTLYPNLVAKIHERRRDLNDILRVNLLPMLANADDPKVDYPYLDPETGEIVTLACSRVYHINVIFRFSTRNDSSQETERYEKIRIVVNRKGIKRVEEVSDT